MTTSPSDPPAIARPAPAAPASPAAAGYGPAALVAAALARARSAKTPRPETPGPRPAPAPGPSAGPPVPVPPSLDRTLRLSLAAADSRAGRLRPVPSAGALHPVAARLLAGPGGPLPPGRYRYDPLAHRLRRYARAPRTAPPGVLAVLTVTAHRTTAHYGHRGWPLLLLDAGHAAAALALAGAHAVCLDADGALLARAAGLTRTDRAHPLAAVRLTPGVPPDALERWAAPPPPDLTMPRTTFTERVLTALTHAPGSRARWHPVTSPGFPDGLLAARRSAPPGFPVVPGDGELAAVLTAARDALPAALSWCAATGGPRPALRELRGDGRLGVLATGDARPTLALWAAGQTWLATTGAVLLAYGCPAGAAPATVRAAHLTAGYAAGFALLTAAALGLRTRPVGSWQGADLGAALGGPAGRDVVVHGLALGRPGPPHQGGDNPS
ncbi:nitroreductase [Streptomyces sp. RS10V-4]|uniref:nitroreductase n=1 Tax=Streptomyces rhizoryzae TaxID=2932493 RepID=UPI002005C07F|nr:nitroreductase [Streptomyces rhizoryzae]MCK7622494.1 nitroreductase [Streptomyces rhizoryzae]